MGSVFLGIILLGWGGAAWAHGEKCVKSLFAAEVQSRMRPKISGDDRSIQYQLQSPSRFKQDAKQAGLNVFVGSRGYGNSHLTGDFYGIAPLPSNPDIFVILVGDAAGHGEEAAKKYSIPIMQAFQAPGFLDGIHSPAEVIYKLSQNISFENNRFAAVQCVLVNRKTYAFSYANAGGLDILILHSDGKIDRLESIQRLIGIYDTPPKPGDSRDGQLLPGDLMIFYTDGITEAELITSEPVEISFDTILYTMLTRLRTRSVPEPQRPIQIVNAMMLYSANGISLDDGTVVILQRPLGER